MPKEAWEFLFWVTRFVILASEVFGMTDRSQAD